MKTKNKLIYISGKRVGKKLSLEEGKKLAYKIIDTLSKNLSLPPKQS